MGVPFSSNPFHDFIFFSEVLTLLVHLYRSATGSTSSLVFPGLQSIPSTMSVVSTTQSISSKSGEKSEMVVETNLGHVPKKFVPKLDPVKSTSVSPANSENFAG